MIRIKGAAVSMASETETTGEAASTPIETLPASVDATPGDSFETPLAALATPPKALSAADVTNAAVFDWQQYLALNGDLGESGITTEAGAKQHWLKYGVDEGRRGRNDFDPRAYVERYGDLSAAYGNDYRAATQHYLTWGRAEGRSAWQAAAASTTTPSSRSSSTTDVADPLVFDWQQYLALNRDLEAAGITTEAGAKKHWLKYGVDEGRQGRTDFDPRAYLERYGDLVAAYGNDYRAATQHYLRWGEAEGRNALPGAAGPTTTPQKPSLRFTDPNLVLRNRGQGTQGLLAETGTSPWVLNQWNTDDFISRDKTVARNDSELGRARVALTTPTALGTVALYDDPLRPGNSVFELSTAGGMNSAVGGRNLFLQQDFDSAVAVDGRVTFDYKIPYANVTKDAERDGVNLVQLHIGLIFHGPTGQALFVQKEMFESNNSPFSAHVDAGTNCPLRTTPLRPGDVNVAPFGWQHASIDLKATLAEALGSKYDTARGPFEYPRHERNLADWSLGGVYMGTETGGTGVLTVQFKNVDFK